MIQDTEAALLGELRWFVRQRWRAGLILIMGAIVFLLQADSSYEEIGILSTGISVLIYNFALWMILQKAPRWIDSKINQRLVAWVQIIFDLAALTVLVTITNGAHSPLLGFFVLHMIFASMLLQPPMAMPYLAWIIAIAMLTLALGVTGQWPQTTPDGLIVLGWICTLFLTIYFTTHITNKININHNRARAVLDAVVDSVLTIDHTGHIEFVNSATVSMFGYSSAQLIGERVDKLISLSNLPGIKIVEDGSQDSSTTSDYSDRNTDGFASCKDGSIFPIDVSISSRGGGPQVTSIIVVRDITRRREAQEKLDKLNQELTKHQEQLNQHEKMVAVGRMAAGVAHEIANPLANIDGLMQLIARNPDSIKEDTPKQIREQVTRIAKIISQLRDFAHPGEHERRIVRVDKLVQSAINMIRFDKRHNKVTIVDQDADLCCQVRIHPYSIQQVLVNLIVNALDAATNEETHRVTIASACLEDGSCRIAIQDNGAGIPEENLKRIFEPFFTTKPMGKGTGLGLSISHSLIRQDGGRIEVKSKVDEGTTVSIYFPTHNKT